MDLKRWSKRLVKVYEATKSMFSFISKPAVAVIQLQEHITPNTTENIRINLDHLPTKLKAIVLLINCQSGSASQATIIKQMIRAKAKERTVNVYAFGQEVCLSTGLILLSAGDKTYVDKSTIVGRGGLEQWNMNIENYLKANYGIQKVGYTSSNSNLLSNEKTQSISPLTFDDEDILNTLSETKQQELRKIIQGFDDKIWSETNEPKLKPNELITGQEAVRRGLAWKIGGFQEIVRKKFPQVKVEYYSRMPTYRIYNKLI